MKPNCPNFECVNFQKKSSVVKDGKYFRSNDSRIVQRYKCTACGKRFSKSTSTLEYRQKKRRVNFKLRQLLCSGVSMRRAAKLLGINKITVHRKVLYLAKKANLNQQQFLLFLKKFPVTHLQFDDLITIEHTKLKPLSVTVAIDASNRKILGAVVSTIPAFGHLVARSIKKYGYRKSTHFKKACQLFKKISSAIEQGARIETDQHKTYPFIVNKFLPHAQHTQYKSERATIAGQGELKKLLYDPLFAINHTCAMLRANINRLIRRTWCTTKKASMLQRHLDIYVEFHNSSLIAA